jgi:hypothetical protein
MRHLQNRPFNTALQSGASQEHTGIIEGDLTERKGWKLETHPSQCHYNRKSSSSASMDATSSDRAKGQEYQKNKGTGTGTKPSREKSCSVMGKVPPL